MKQVSVTVDERLLETLVSTLVLHVQTTEILLQQIDTVFGEGTVDRLMEQVRQPEEDFGVCKHQRIKTLTTMGGSAAMHICADCGIEIKTPTE